ncbi:hypothetical protein BDV95DRAFT_610241 [Massariosphaeria phaeospora]|uniref:BTB domain-containing protein n=1 Tax=Massariosphaeria phaeospora TaxID=100035 RepID=A0A7C8M4Q5_9PLEO|nr:hypothetical protein BDV95DRAFT_610241 [Massariosphaeria phaeospora]
MPPRLLASGEFSDFVITCGDKTWNVHKTILCPRSGFFARAINFGKEKDEGKIDLPDDDSTTVEYMLQFLYGADYPSTNITPTDGPDHMKIFRKVTEGSPREMCWKLHELFSHANLEAMEKTQELIIDAANRGYGLYRSPTGDVLKLLRDPKSQDEPYITRTFNCAVVTDAKMYCIGDKYDIPSLKQSSSEKFEVGAEEFALGTPCLYEAIELLMENTPEIDRSIRKTIVSCLCTELVQFGITPGIQALIDRYPTLNGFILEHLVGKYI